MNHEQFIGSFEACSLPPDEWTHAAHIRMAWYYLSRIEFEHAIVRIRDGIRAYNENVLDKLDEYHETVTVAFARIIAARIKNPDESWAEFEARNPDLFAKRPVLLNYYSRELLGSEAARKAFVAADLKDLP